MPGKANNKWDLFIVWDDPGGNPREAADRSGSGQFLGAPALLILSESSLPRAAIILSVNVLVGTKRRKAIPGTGTG